MYCIGCTPENVSPVPIIPECQTPIKLICVDKVMLLDEDILKAGIACPENTRLIFPYSDVQRMSVSKAKF